MMEEIPAYNQGYTAGKKSGAFNLGTNANPLKIAPNNILDLFVDMDAVALENETRFGGSRPEAVYYLTRVGMDNDSKTVRVVAVFHFNPIDPAKG